MAARPRDIGAAGDVLRHHRERALVLAGELRPGRIELHAVALQRAARRNVGVERGLAQRLASKPPYFRIARGSTSERKIQVLLNPIETCGGNSPGPFTAW